MMIPCTRYGYDSVELVTTDGHNLAPDVDMERILTEVLLEVSGLSEPWVLNPYVDHGAPVIRAVVILDPRGITWLEIHDHLPSLLFDSSALPSVGSTTVSPLMANAGRLAQTCG
jgi:hypothetical protein